MLRSFFRKKILKPFRRRRVEIDPDEILIDSTNLPGFDTNQFEGRLEKRLSRRTLFFLGSVFALVLVLFSVRIWNLQIAHGEEYAEKSEQNRLRHSIIFADRGVIRDRNGDLLAWNEPSEEGGFSRRVYTALPGFGHILGYVTPPLKDKSGYFYQTDFLAHDGAEEAFDEVLRGKSGLKIIETDALGAVVSESLLQPPRAGNELTLSIDEGVQEALYRSIKELAEKVDFQGGAGAIMDVRTGEILALVSYPEYDPQILADGSDHEAISRYLTSSQTPFLNRVLNVFTPGSIVKPYLALGALTEGIISPEKQILSTGSISIPNPYDPKKESIFRDWKAHGLVDMRHAIAVSSDVYFYEIGGGYRDQKGLGIANIDKYMRLFGFGSKTGIDIGQEKTGVIPTPEWKEEVFPGDPWRIGDTYNTAIGQYGVQVTPMQALRAVASLANGGILLTPTVLKKSDDDPSLSPEAREEERLPISPSYFKIAREGMRLGVEVGTAAALNISGVEVAAKTGTAELGVTKQRVNSWVTGFFPYENPRYAFVVLMEKGHRGNLYGSPLVMRDVLGYLLKEKPDYVK